MILDRGRVNIAATADAGNSSFGIHLKDDTGVVDKGTTKRELKDVVLEVTDGAKKTRTSARADPAWEFLGPAKVSQRFLIGDGETLPSAPGGNEPGTQPRKPADKEPSSPAKPSESKPATGSSAAPWWAREAAALTGRVVALIAGIAGHAPWFERHTKALR